MAYSKCFVVAAAGLAACAFLAGCSTDARVPEYERTRAEHVTDVYHGVTVEDPYRWLEDWSNADVKAWSERQNVVARTYLDGLTCRPAVKARLEALEGGGSVRYGSLKFGAGLKKYLAMKHQPPKQQDFLVMLSSTGADRVESVLVDPNVIDPSGSTTIDWYVPSPDGKLLAVSMSKGGSEAGDVHVFDVATGADREVVTRGHGGTAGGSLCWSRDSRAFFYTRYPHAGERASEDLDFYVQIYRHTLGTPESQDVYESGKDFPKIAEIILEASADGQVLASVQKGDGGEFFHLLRGTDGHWQQLSRYEDQVVDVTFAPKASAFGALEPTVWVSRDGVPRGRIAAHAAGGPTVSRLVEQGSYSIDTDFTSGKGVTVVGDRLFVQYQAGGPSEVAVYSLAGSLLGKLSLPPICAVNEVVAGPDGEALVEVESFTAPAAWYQIRPGTLELAPTDLKQSSPADYSDCEVVREYANSKDGTRVPLNIMRLKGTVLDGNSPTVLWGYGGYGVNQTPGFSARRRVFLEQGGVYVIANIRGGGEFGEEWHRAGNLTHKQNVFDDFHAAAQWMVDHRYTRREKLAIMGGSNGGLLMGATLTQHPDLCKAVVSSVGIYDMLRVELSANGAFNVTEFGSVKDRAQFTALNAYSPYHHVAGGTRYPNVLFLTGANDPRVDPMQSRKMTARLQAASPKSLTLLRTSANAGHGIGSSLSERIEQNADIYAFLFDQLGVSMH